MKDIENLNIKIFADGANRQNIIAMYKKPFIKGFTTNPTLMRMAGVNDYKSFCIDILKIIKDRPISFEVFSDDFDEMKRQAMEISNWGENVYVKIPITNTKKEYSYVLIEELSALNIKINITAIMTIDQVRQLIPRLNKSIPAYVSVFAGRIADTGVDPVPIMIESLALLKDHPFTELIWASPRELLNIFQAEKIGCHVITVTDEIIKKLSLVGYDLNNYSLDTVVMFYKDALAAGYKI